MSESRSVDHPRRPILRAVKRAADLIIGASALIVLSPLILLVALAIWITMGPPVIFRQPRLGHRGRVFIIYKFRTMTEARGSAGELLPDAERLTPLGRFLRQLTLDELPELVNVLRGEMSLVGPRPLLVEYRDLYSPEQWRRHDVPPGMAGPVLVGGRNVLPWGEKFRLDVWYVDHWSLALDVAILFRTLIRVLRREGISQPGHATMPKFSGTQTDQGHTGRP
jgi:sugar transferase EpsL